jgi:DNA-directed RNA polymerase subunit RPC12/RpoP
VNGRRYVTLERNQAGIIQNRYSCSECWNPVRVCHDENGDYLECGTEGCSCKGLVTTRFVDKMIMDSLGKYMTAKYIFKDLYPELFPKSQKKEKKTEWQNLKELGF